MNKVTGLTGDLINSHKIVKVDDLQESYALSGSIKYPYAEFFSDISTIGLETLNSDYKYGLKYDKTNLGGVSNKDKIYDTPIFGSNVFIDGVRRTKFDHVDKNQTQVNGHDLYLSFIYKTGELGIYDHIKINSISYYLCYKYYDENNNLLDKRINIYELEDAVNISSYDNIFYIENEYNVRVSGPSVSGPTYVGNKRYTFSDNVNLPHYDLSNEITYIDNFLNIDDDVITDFNTTSNNIQNINNEYIGKDSYIIPSQKYTNYFRCINSGTTCIKLKSNYDFNKYNLCNVNVEVNPLSCILVDLILNKKYVNPSTISINVLEGNNYNFEMYFDPINIDNKYLSNEYISIEYNNAVGDALETSISFNLNDKKCFLNINTIEGKYLGNLKICILKISYPCYNGLTKSIKLFVYFYTKPLPIYVNSYPPNIINDFNPYVNNWNIGGWHKFSRTQSLYSSDEYIVHDYNNKPFDKEYRNAPLYIAIPESLSIYPCVDIFSEDKGKDINSFRKTYINVNFINNENDNLSYVSKYVLYIEKDPATRYYTNKLKYIK